MPTIGDRLLHAWNAFAGRDPTVIQGVSNYNRIDRPKFTRGSEKSIITSVCNRIAMDVSSVKIRHIRLDDNDRFIEILKSGLDDCLNVEANVDQTGRALIQDIVISMLDEGCVAVVPVDTDISPINTGSYDILSMRTGKIVEWKPKDVKIRIYNENTSKMEEIWLPKKSIAIIENPLYAVMNEPNSTMQRLRHKLALLDYVDEQSSTGKLDLIIQLPYIVKSEARRKQAEERRKDIEMQLTGSKYGVAYTDGTERITQLNRSLDNQLVTQVENLQKTLYSQLGITEEIMNGTANESTMNNYYYRTIEPILSAIVDEMKRKFLTKTARTQKQSISFFRDPFRLVPISDLAELADKLTRNEILTSNEFRQILGMAPSQEPNADQLRNKNMPIDDSLLENQNGVDQSYDEAGYLDAASQLDDIDAQLDEMEASLGHSDEDDSIMHYASKYYDPVKAHEYYVEYTKKQRLKGRDSNGQPSEYSTSMLNDQGKMAYKQIKESLQNEKKTRSDASSAATKASLESNSASAKAQINSNNSSMQAELAAKKEATKNEISSHSEKMSKEIESLQEKIKSLAKNGSQGSINAIQSKILNLRKQNEQKRAELNAAYQQESANLKAKNQASNESVRESSKQAAEGIRAGHKATVSGLKEEYSQKQKDELKRLVDSGEFKAVKKGKGSGKGKKGSSTKWSSRLK